MFRLPFCGAVIAAALVVAVWPGTAVAEDDELVPFEVQLEGFASPVFNPDGSISNTELALGESAQLGSVTWMSEEEAVFNDTNELKVKGEFVITMANGDQVFGKYKTIGTIAFPVGTFEGHFVITGGTGRFADASGNGTIFGVGNLLSPFEIVGSLSGKISRPCP
jgi:hypothetical protein